MLKHQSVEPLVGQVVLCTGTGKIFLLLLLLPRFLDIIM
jgi:hypothetical protein